MNLLHAMTPAADPQLLCICIRAFGCPGVAGMGEEEYNEQRESAPCLQKKERDLDQAACGQKGKASMGIFPKAKVNTGRQPEIDCLRAFCILNMILVHVFEECAENPGRAFFVLDVMETLTGASVFMICMGISIRYSKNQSAHAFFSRGFGLLTTGQLLYLLRDAFPNLIAFWCTRELPFLSRSLLVFQADILTFAGFAFLLLGICTFFRVPDWAILAIGAVMNMAAFGLFQVFRTTGSFLADQILGFFVVTDAESYFPLCCYFIFVAFGYVLGELYLRIPDKDRLANRVLAYLLPLSVAYFMIRVLVPFPMMPALFTTEQYVLNPLTDAVANIARAVCLLALFYKLISLGGGKVPALASHLSRHITQYYFISFLFFTPLGIFLKAVTGHRMMGWLIPLLYGVFVLIACYFIIEWNDKHLNLSFQELKGKKRVVICILIWVISFMIVAYAYPRVDEYATFWNDYLL